jgi:hypothetical protein
MPKTVKPWMCYTQAGEMRMNMFRYGGYVDKYCGWNITWDSTLKEYRVSEHPGNSVTFGRKNEAYSFARQNVIAEVA